MVTSPRTGVRGRSDCGGLCSSSAKAGLWGAISKELQTEKAPHRMKNNCVFREPETRPRDYPEITDNRRPSNKLKA